ncbi:hypothetical protein BKA67DRAFT_559448 [Truncatella angustata]|uniref:MARVEL domain-containing protein n=1 Tax=Truncatella angustata TaxID=152316 RepID=A0A9P8ZYE9_9PEZI|nr:uncharacterized protein BKA67DRAFT_559448 [Truncatella angustata]KAH6655087.1 hypothetical protein BKA67DRAFT_559448 [Truncatella angustata]KAH8195697.1 hypothetical protein TruAng_010128 [Truncatella angustata]
MGAKGGLALKSLQWFIRGIEFGCAAVALGIFSYFLAALTNNGLGIPIWSRAVEGLSGSAVLYTLIGLLLLCCVAGHSVFSLIAIVLDVCFIGAFIYIAIENRHGAGSCQGNVNTIFGSGNSGSQITGTRDGFTSLPTFHQACQLHTAVFAVSIIAAFFFLLSALVEFALMRNHRKEKRFGPSPDNNYTSGSGRKSRFGMFGKKRGTNATTNDNALPTHTSPDQIRQSYNTETTAVGRDSTAFNKHGESGYAHDGIDTTTGVAGYNNHQSSGLAHNNETVPQQTGYTGHAGGIPEIYHGNANGHSYPDTTGRTHAAVSHNQDTPAGYRYNDGTYTA